MPSGLKLRDLKRRKFAGHYKKWATSLPAGPRSPHSTYNRGAPGLPSARAQGGHVRAGSGEPTFATTHAGGAAVGHVSATVASAGGIHMGARQCPTHPGLARSTITRYLKRPRHTNLTRAEIRCFGSHGSHEVATTVLRFVVHKSLVSRYLLLVTANVGHVGRCLRRGYLVVFSSPLIGNRRPTLLSRRGG